MTINFKEYLAFVDFPENQTDNELRATVLNLNLNLSNISKALLDFTTDSGASDKFCREVNNIRERIQYLYTLTDAASHYDQIDNAEHLLRRARLGVIYACDDFYHCNDKTLATIEKYLYKQ